VSIEHVDLVIGGMTCASCANRLEKRLNRLDGVTATVNLATEKARVDYPDTISTDDLLAAVAQAGYTADLPAPPVPSGDPFADGHDDHGHHAAVSDLGRRTLIAAVLAVPVIAMAMIPTLQFTNWQWLSLVLAAPVVVWAGWPFHQATWANLRHGAATMDTLISVGTISAFVWSLCALFLGTAGEPGMKHTFAFTITRTDGSSAIYLEAAAGVTTFILLGRYLEERAKRRAGSALRAVLDLGAKDVAVLSDGIERRVPIGALAVGDTFIVRPGEKVATDGVVVEGRSALDASVVTGESLPVEVGPHDEVVGATINQGGRLLVRAARIGADTQLAQIARLVEDAQTGKAQVQRLADRISAVFVPVVIALSVATLAGWVVSGTGWSAAFTAAVAVLIIACPCALGLATPVALMVGTGRDAQLGILLKGPEVLESTRRVDTIVLDKTGTVTEGRMRLVDVVPAAGVERDELLRLAGAAEEGSEHPIARAIVDSAREQGALPAADSFTSRAGLGVEAVVNGQAVLVGRPAFLAEWGLELSEGLQEALAAAEDEGRTVVAVAWDGALRGLLVVSDRVKATSAGAVADLKRLGLVPVLLTGDNERAARAVAATVGIERVLAEVLPGEKAAEVKRLQEAGEVVAMVGDGVNDAPALAQADLGLAIGTGTDVAIEASDLTLVSGDLRAAVDAIRLSRHVLKTIKGNLFWAFAYNVAAIPLAVIGVLNPIIAAAAMAFSSVFVVSNSLRLRRFSSERETPESAPPTLTFAERSAT